MKRIAAAHAINAAAAFVLFSLLSAGFVLGRIPGRDIFLSKTYNAGQSVQTTEPPTAHAIRTRTYTAFFFCAILGYLAGRLFRKRITPGLERKSALRSWAILIVSVTIVPYAAVRLLDVLGLTSRFINIFRTTWGVVAAVGIVLGFVIVIVMIPIIQRDKWKARRRQNRGQ